MGETLQQHSLPEFEPESNFEPELIQGGMGVGVSNWRLAREVAMVGERHGRRVLGVVSGAGLTGVIVTRLGFGDEDERRAVQAFPVPEIAREILDKYWLKNKSSSQFTLPPKPEVLINGSKRGKDLLTKLLVVANFAEVWLAKQGHGRPIGINFLEKVQLLHLPQIYGAMLAGVDYVLVGAGLPTQVPGVLDKLSNNEAATYRIDVTGSEKYEMKFDHASFMGKNPPALRRPKFLAIVSLHVAAQVLAQRSNGEINGFIVESPIAGGHNAPPRSKQVENGIPIYGPKDEPDLTKIIQLGKPIWLAGGKASPESFREARAAGAAGIQVGSAFALSDESGINPDIKKELRRKGFEGTLEVIPSAIASPTGFPFQVAQLDGSLSNPDVYAERDRKCNYGYLVEAYKTPEGKIGFRCAAEPTGAYNTKGGQEDTAGKQCVCSALGATADMAPGPYIVTLGQDLEFLDELMTSPDSSYSAADVIRNILPNPE